MYGIKGRIDVTVNATVQKAAANGSLRTTVTPMPLELKSGKVSKNTSYWAQVLIYCLLLSDRYNLEIQGGSQSLGMYLTFVGLLWGLAENVTKLEKSERKHLIPIIDNRNQLAIALKNHTIPDPIVYKWPCGGCFYLDQCALAHKVRIL